MSCATVRRGDADGVPKGISTERSDAAATRDPTASGFENLYPDGPIAVEALRVIGPAMAEAGVVGLGRLTSPKRQRAQPLASAPSGECMDKPGKTPCVSPALPTGRRLPTSFTAPRSKTG
jgi:hypothetical protein